MGTHCLTRVFEGLQTKEGKRIGKAYGLVAIYRQYDGYLEGHGKDLAQILVNRDFVNGITGSEIKASNGAGCFAAELVMLLKKSQTNRQRYLPKGHKPHQFGRLLTKEEIEIQRQNAIGNFYLVPFVYNQAKISGFSYIYDIYIDRVQIKEKKPTREEALKAQRAFALAVQRHHKFVEAIKAAPKRKQAEMLAQRTARYDKLDRQRHEQQCALTRVTVKVYSLNENKTEDIVFFGTAKKFCKVINRLKLI